MHHYLRAVESARDAVRNGALTKAVIAREITVRSSEPIDVHAVLRRLRATFGRSYRYSIDGFIGASPELLIAVHGNDVQSHPLAGTTPRTGDPDTDRRAADEADRIAPGEPLTLLLSAQCAQLAGDRPSFNDLLDLDAAYRIAADFTAPTVALVKHTDPVGLASNDELVEAYRKALDTDPVSAFGGVVAVNRELDGATAREIAANSYEAVVAPAFSQAALGILRDVPGLELVAVPASPTEGLRDYGIASLDFKRVAGGLLVETQDELGLDKGQLQVVTKRRPSLEELTDLLFAWRAVRHVRSNAIVLARNAGTVGVGAAQASRTISVEIALRRAGERARTAVLASDAYFPFPDGIQLAAQAGVTAIIQPGGSMRDECLLLGLPRLERCDMIKSPVRCEWSEFAWVMSLQQFNRRQRTCSRLAPSKRTSSAEGVTRS